MEVQRFDFLVIGSGLAGLTFALRASKLGSVCVLTKGDVTDSNTNWAQGGIAAAVGEADSWELHERDTLIAGAGECDEQAVRFLVQDAPKAIDWLIELGARFDSEGDDLSLGREGGHSRNRIVHHADRTGWEIERAMVAAVRAQSNITIFPHSFVESLLMDGSRCVGALAQVNNLGTRAVLAGNVMLASGGAGKVYQHTTNPSVATADGIALASGVGAQIANMEFMQFHPTTLYHDKLRSFLISEAVRGAGATLRNHLGRRFMYDYDERLELAPRDVVARAIEAEIQKHSTWCVYLDATHLDPDRIRHEFPTIYNRLEGLGIEMEKEWIPIVPAQHYSCGGVVTDLCGRTNIPGLYAAGEVACTGVHGANRLASNSLLEALVFARAAAGSIEPYTPKSFDVALHRKSISEGEAVRIRRSMQKMMTKNVGIVRTHSGLQETHTHLVKLRDQFASLPSVAYSQYALEAENLLVAASHIVDGAIARKKNVGLHYNADLA